MMNYYYHGSSSFVILCTNTQTFRGPVIVVGKSNLEWKNIGASASLSS